MRWQIVFLLLLGISKSAVGTAGNAMCAGSDAQGQVGNGATTTSIAIPTQVVFSGTAPNLVQIAVGDSHSVAVDDTGLVWGWGYNGDGSGFGALGAGCPGTNSLVPINPTWTTAPPGGVVQVSTTDIGTIALGADKLVYVWGRNSFTRAVQADTCVPQALTWSGGTPAPADGIAQISGGSMHVLALSTLGVVYAWGGGFTTTYGQLGDGTTTGRTFPVLVNWGSVTPNPAPILYVSAGQVHSAVIGSDRNVYSFGDNLQGQIGIGNNVGDVPPATTVRSPKLMLWNGSAGRPNCGVSMVAAGGGFSIMLGGDQKVYSVGLNSDGQLGVPSSTASSNFPVAVVWGAVPEPAGIISVSAGKFAALAIGANGLVYSWGSDSFGQLGSTATSTSSFQPVQFDTSGIPSRFLAQGQGLHQCALTGNVPSASPSISTCPSGSNTPTPSITPSMTRTPSVSPSPTPSISSTPSASPTSAASQSTSVTTTPTSSLSNGASPSNTASTTPSLSLSSSISGSISVTSSISTSGSVTASITPSLSITSSTSLSSSITPTISLTSSITPTISVSPMTLFDFCQLNNNVFANCSAFLPVSPTSTSRDVTTESWFWPFIGVTIGLCCLLTAVLIFCCIRRKKRESDRKRLQEEENATDPTNKNGSINGRTERGLTREEYEKRLAEAKRRQAELAKKRKGQGGSSASGTGGAYSAGTGGGYSVAGRGAGSASAGSVLGWQSQAGTGAGGGWGPETGDAAEWFVAQGPDVYGDGRGGNGNGNGEYSCTDSAVSSTLPHPSLRVIHRHKDSESESETQTLTVNMQTLNMPRVHRHKHETDDAESATETGNVRVHRRVGGYQSPMGTIPVPNRRPPRPPSPPTPPEPQPGMFVRWIRKRRANKEKQRQEKLRRQKEKQGMLPEGGNGVSQRSQLEEEEMPIEWDDDPDNPDNQQRDPAVENPDNIFTYLEATSGDGKTGGFSQANSRRSHRNRAARDATSQSATASATATSATATSATSGFFSNAWARIRGRPLLPPGMPLPDDEYYSASATGTDASDTCSSTAGYSATDNVRGRLRDRRRPANQGRFIRRGKPQKDMAAARNERWDMDAPSQARSQARSQAVPSSQPKSSASGTGSSNKSGSGSGSNKSGSGSKSSNKSGSGSSAAKPKTKAAQRPANPNGRRQVTNRDFLNTEVPNTRGGAALEYDSDSALAASSISGLERTGMITSVRVKPGKRGVPPMDAPLTAKRTQEDTSLW